MFVISSYLSQVKLSESLDIQVDLLKLQGHRLSYDLLLFLLSNLGKEWMSKAVLKSDSEVGVKHESSLQEVNRLVTCSWVHLTKISLWSVSE